MSTSRNFKNETDKIAKRLLENELAISQCQNLDDYRETHFVNEGVLLLLIIY